MGCVDPDAAPVVTQDTLLFGAFPFLEELKTGEYDLANLSSSAYEMDVYFVDNAQGADVAQYNVYVSFDDNNLSNGDSGTERALFKSYTPSDFAPLGEKGNLGLTVRIPFTEVAGFAGVDGADVVISGDRFQFTTEIVKTDGRVFSSANSTPAVTNAFGGIWDFNVTATCPLNDDFYVGTYKMTYASIYPPIVLFGRTIQAFGPDLDENVELVLVPGSTTLREFTTPSYLAPSNLQSSVTNRFEFSCDVVTSTFTDSGIACSGAGWRPIQVDPVSFSLADDSGFSVNYRDFGEGNTGNCGDIGAQAYTVIYTKQ